MKEYYLYAAGLIIGYVLVVMVRALINTRAELRHSRSDTRVLVKALAQCGRRASQARIEAKEHLATVHMLTDEVMKKQTTRPARVPQQGTGS